MTLPTIDVPIYELKIPSTGEPIKIRPFLVKEEKLLLMAVETKDENEIINTTKQIINNCIVEGEVNVDKLPFFDIDYLFIALRGKSIGESIDVSFTCRNRVDGAECNTIFDAKIDIANVEIEKDESITHTIDLTGGITVIMKYPNYTAMRLLTSKESNLEKKVNIVVACIERISKDNKTYDSKDYTKVEMTNFVTSMTEENYKKLENFVNNFPSFHVNSEAKCPKCGFVHKIKYKDFTSFFL
jgi:hypothetical protein